VPDEYDLGILFVHGIGAQQRGDTLLQFGEPLMQSVQQWLGRDALVLSGTDIAPSTSERPAHTYATVTTHDAERRIFAAESWWAETFHPPHWWPMAAWLIFATPFVVFRAFDHRVGMVTTNQRLDDPKRSRLRRAPRHIERVAKNVVSSTLVVVASIVIALLGIVAVIPAVRRFILSAQTLLIRYIGDSYALLVGAGGDAMVSRVERDLEWLEEQKVKKVVIVAHSQGAAIVWRVLERRPADSRPIASLVTLGQGIAKLRAVERMYNDRGKAIGAYLLRIVAAAFSIGPLVLVLWWSWFGVAAVVLCGNVLAALLISWARRILQRIVRDDRKVFGTELAKMVRAGKLRRWRDYFATSDPVPEGKLPLEDLGLDLGASVKMANLRSPFFDHTSYWQNAEGFRPAVLQELAAMLGFGLFESRVSRGMAARRRWTWVLVGATWLFIGVAITVCVVGLIGPAWFGLWHDVGRHVGSVMASVAGLFNDTVQKWLKRDSGNNAATIASVVIACAAGYLAVMVGWQFFATRRGNRVLRS
jgi:pimeloyl-ACP methyl ester carboxylesterase